MYGYNRNFIKTMLTIILDRKGRILKNEFLLAVASQGVKLDILIVNSENKDISDREWLRQKALNLAPNDKYFLLLNSDVVFETEKDVQELIDYLDKYKNYGAIAYDTRNRDEKALIHVDIACMLIRREVLEKVVFHKDPKRLTCTCDFLCDDIKVLGYKVGYLLTHRLKELREPSWTTSTRT